MPDVHGLPERHRRRYLAAAAIAMLAWALLCLWIGTQHVGPVGARGARGPAGPPGPAIWVPATALPVTPPVVSPAPANPGAGIGKG